MNFLGKELHQGEWNKVMLFMGVYFIARDVKEIHHPLLYCKIPQSAEMASAAAQMVEKFAKMRGPLGNLHKKCIYES